MEKFRHKSKHLSSFGSQIMGPKKAKGEKRKQTAKTFHFSSVPTRIKTSVSRAEEDEM
jgi:hypothetical protein